MFINPKTAIEQQWIKFPEWMTDEQKQKCIQPNALDFTVDRIKQLSTSSCSISEQQKTFRRYMCNTESTTTDLIPVDGVSLDTNTLKEVHSKFYYLQSGVYDITSDFYVDVPVGVAVLLYPRSTFVRNGLFIANGIFDTGFKGNLGCTLHNPLGFITLEQHVRIGQVAFVKSEYSGVYYSGGYNTKEGQHWVESKDQHFAANPPDFSNIRFCTTIGNDAAAGGLPLDDSFGKSQTKC